MKLCLQCNTHYDDRVESCPSDQGKLIDVGNDPALGTTVSDRYKVLQMVGKGSMGVVYKAIQLSTGRETAIKFLKNIGDTGTSDEALIKRFQREAKTLSSLKHPNIVTLFDFGFNEAHEPYIVTEFLHGLTLTNILKQHGFLNTKKTVAVFKQVCDAVSEAHRHKIVHRDIKPDNILLQGKDSGGRFVKVLDFGIAKLLSDSGVSAGATALTMEGRVCGSPAYMSPEQCKGIEVDYRCDIYALGVVLFETLTGRRLFPGDDAMSVMFAHVNESPPHLASIRDDPAFSRDLELVIMKALSKEPKHRQQSVEEFFDDFAAACAGKPRKSIQSGWRPLAPAYGTDTLKDRAQREIAASGVDWEAVQNSSSGSNVMYLHEFRRKRRQFFMACAAALALIGGFFLYDQHKERVAVETADILSSSGRPEDAVWFLEKLRAQHALTGEDTERLNSAYLKSAIKFAKRKNYAQAVEMLQRVSNHSRYSDQVNGLMRRYKRKLASS